MKRTDTKSGRFYDSGGRKLPSVTTILGALAKPALIGWAAKEERRAVIASSYAVYEETVSSGGGTPVDFATWEQDVNLMLGPQKAHQKLMREAAEIGTDVHAYIEATLRRELHPDEPLPEDPTHLKVQECIDKWWDWRQETNLKPVAIEKRVASQDYGFAGSLDLLAEVDGELAVIDFKTGKAIYAEAYLQNIAYRLALQEEGIYARKGYIVRLPKDETDPTFEVGEVPPMEDLLLPFVCLIPVWRWLHAEEKAYQARKKEAASA
jgi:hypothetical protein